MAVELEEVLLSGALGLAADGAVTEHFRTSGETKNASCITLSGEFVHVYMVSGTIIAVNLSRVAAYVERLKTTDY